MRLLFGRIVAKMVLTYPFACANMTRSLGAIIMNSYKFYLKDRENVVVGSGGFDAEDSDTAIRLVRVRSAAWPLSCHSYELLQDDRVIYCESLPPDTDMQKRH